MTKFLKQRRWTMYFGFLLGIATGMLEIHLWELRWWLIVVPLVTINVLLHELSRKEYDKERV